MESSKQNRKSKKEKKEKRRKSRDSKKEEEPVDPIPVESTASTDPVESTDPKQSPESRKRKRSKDSKEAGKESKKSRKKSKNKEGDSPGKKSKKEKRKSKNGSSEPTDSSEPQESNNESRNKSDNGQEVKTPIIDRKKGMQFREKHHITVDNEGSDFFQPCESFADAGFPSDLVDYLSKDFKQPTPIQAQCWPILMKKRDVVGIAETGSGKTLGFGLPGLVHIKNSSRNGNPSFLVLAPTRELAMQSSDVLEKVARQYNIKVGCIYGGADKNTQRDAIKKGLSIIIATPGRLIDFINEGVCKLDNVHYFVLDEADRLLDMGFEKDIRFIISCLPKNRQTLMFSATWPVAIQQFASTFLNNPIKVTIGSENLSANKAVEQIVEVIEAQQRDNRLLQLLKQYHQSRKNKILVFVLYKKEATYLENFLNRRGWNAISIHGDKTQSQRTAALQAFVNGRSPLLIATDVAARGLDIPQVAYVINYSFPLTIEDYVHRIGRTGRAGATGISHTFFQKFDKAHTGELVAILKESKQNIPKELLAFGIATKKKEPTLGRINLETSQSSHITFDSDEE